tara:strand:- start:92 stop:937 length:846 start_codon:yes stop_codon:yes gene_type:complete
MNIENLLNQSINILKSKKNSSASLDSELILAKTLNVSRESLLIDLNKEVSKKKVKDFHNFLIQRINQKPIAYIIGKKDFWKSSFVVNENVLIPRPDTELIVEEALKLIKIKKSYKILDIGTGSGCILLSILKQSTKSKGIGLDISHKALKIANLNAKLQQLDNRVKFIKSDIDNYNSSNYDIIVSNPPYIKKYCIKSLEEDVKYFEPNIALDGGPKGETLIEKVIFKSSKIIKRRGKLILEINSDQVFFAKNKLTKNGFYLVKIIKDLSGHSRCIVATKLK